MTNAVIQYSNSSGIAAVADGVVLVTSLRRSFQFPDSLGTEADNILNSTFQSAKFSYIVDPQKKCKCKAQTLLICLLIALLCPPPPMTQFSRRTRIHRHSLPLFVPRSGPIHITPSDGHGNPDPCGIAGTGVTGMGTGEKKVTRDVPIPVLAGDGSVTRSVRCVDQPP